MHHLAPSCGRPCRLYSVADLGGEQIRPWPPSKLSMEFGPLGGRKSNDNIVNLSKCKYFAPPLRIDVGYHIKTLKRSMTKKGHQTFWEMTFFGKC